MQPETHQVSVRTAGLQSPLLKQASARRWLTTGLAGLFSMVLISCSGGGGDPATSSTAVLGPAGGTLVGPDGVQVVVPAGALSQPTTLSVTRSSVGSPTTAPEDNAAGPIYEFLPHGLVFNKPVTIRMPVPGNAPGTAVFMASPGEDWQVSDATVTGGVAEWQRNSFSWGMIPYACAPSNKSPYSAINPDPYPCTHPRGWATASAMPTTVITKVIAGNPFNSAGSWVVNEAGTVQMTLNYQTAPDCQNPRAKLIRWNPAVSGGVQTLFNAPVALTIQTVSIPAGAFATGTGTYSRGVGSTTVPVPFSHLDNTINASGIHAFGFSFSCNRPFRPTLTGGDILTFISAIPVPTVTYTIGGTVSGLTGSGLVLQNNLGDNLAVAANSTSFAFATPVAAGAPYGVTVQTQPAGQTCTVQNGSGTASANVTNVAVSCIAGMAWQGATLIETGSGNLPVVPSIAMDPNGNAFAIWVQAGGGFFPDIWTNRYVAGTGWEPGTLMEASDTNVGIPSIAMQDNGNAIAVWPQTDGIRDSIWASRYVVGTGWSTPVLIETDNAGHAYTPRITIDAGGNAIAVWSQYDGTRNDIWANRYVAGTGWGTATLIEADNAGTAQLPRVAMDSNGNAIAVWYQFDGNRYNVWANRYAVGTGWGSATLIETDNTGNAGSHSIAMDANGNAIAVWAQSDGTRYSVWANRYVAGSGWGTAALLETDNAGDADPGPVVMDANGNAMVAWSQSDGTRTNVWANRYVAGTGWGTATLIETDNAGDVSIPSIAMNAGGNAVAVWHQSDGTRTNIWANRYVAGTGWGTASLIETDNVGDAIYPSVVMAANGNAIATWLQWDGMSNNIMANVFK